ncbi:hypothetical protein EVAR_62039_1 [Eumeta japonica]|uniref:Uncharacterized protein n=1 Tax=Eumeta variegata TaxID=151549 RepID=A0A4C1YS94_EUMVA|nr:hypothetical protein EVAR_62039_1 [Eumeta japonica]
MDAGNRSYGFPGSLTHLFARSTQAAAYLQRIGLSSVATTPSGDLNMQIRRPPRAAAGEVGQTTAAAVLR